MIFKTLRNWSFIKKSEKVSSSIDPTIWSKLENILRIQRPRRKALAFLQNETESIDPRLRLRLQAYIVKVKYNWVEIKISAELSGFRFLAEFLLFKLKTFNVYNRMSTYSLLNLSTIE